MKYIYLLLLLVPMLLQAKEVPKHKAQSFALNFIQKKNKQINGVTTQLKSTSSANYHIINFEPEGWAIISADDVSEPVIAYSLVGHFDLSEMPDAVKFYLKSVDNTIDSLKNVSGLEADAKWQLTNKLKDGAKTVEPFLKTKWGQNCIADEFGSKPVPVTGCVATAFATVLYHYAYPNKGQNSHSYKPEKYDRLSVDYSTRTYNWAAMTTGARECDEAKAQLMFDCGVAVDMAYDVAENGGSASSTASIPAALTKYFKYAPTAYCLSKNGNEVAFIEAVINELNQIKPVILSGRNGDNGHAFIADGYDEEQKLHLDMGWDGNGNGYYTFNDLRGFNNGVMALLDIKQPTSAITAYPYTESFEATTNWEYGGFIADVSVDNNATDEGTKAFKLSKGVLTKKIKIPADAELLELSYKFMGDATGATSIFSNQLRVIIKDKWGVNELETIQDVYLRQNNRIEWAEKKVNLDKYRGQTIRIVFDNVNKYMSDSYYYIDDVKIVSKADMIKPVKANKMDDPKSILIEWNKPVDISSASIKTIQLFVDGRGPYEFSEWGYLNGNKNLLWLKVNWYNNLPVSGSLKVKYEVKEGMSPIVGNDGSTIENSELIDVNFQVVTALNDELEEAIYMYPNPANDKISFSVYVEHLQVFDMAGSKIFEQKSINAYSPLSISNLESGIYMVTIVSKEKNSTFKLIKQ